MCQSVTKFPITEFDTEFNDKPVCLDSGTLVQYSLTEWRFVCHVGLMSSISVPALRRKASLMQVLQALREKTSWKSRNTKKSQHTTNLTQEIDWERQERVVPLLWQEAAKN